MSSTTTRSQIGSDDIKWWDGVNDTFTRLTSTGGSLTLNALGDSVDVLEAYGSGTAWTSASIQNAVNALGSRVRRLLLRAGTWEISDDLTIPANLTIQCLPGCILNVATTKTLTVNGHIEAGPYQIFTYAGTGAFANLKSARAEWFGVSASASAANNATYLTKAGASMDSDGGWLTLTVQGTYNINSATIPAQVTLDIAPGAILSVANTYTLTVNGFINAGLYKIFAFAGSGAVAGLVQAQAEWFGVAAAASAANNAAWMQDAVNAMSTSGSHLTLTIPGTYNADTRVALKSYLRLTLEKGVTWASSGGIRVFEGLGTVDFSTSVNSAYTMGDSTLVVVDASGLAADDLIFVYSNTATETIDFSIIRSISVNTLTLKFPLTYSWSSGAGNVVSGGSGYVRDITLDGGGTITDLAATASTYLVSFQNAYNCTARDLNLELYSVAGNIGRFAICAESTGTRKAAYCTFENLKCIGNPEMAIETYLASFRTTIKNCFSQASTNGISVRGTGHIVDGNMVQGATYGIQCNDTFKLQVVNNQLYGISDVGIVLGAYAETDKLVANNIVKGDCYGISIYGTDPGTTYGIIITGNDFRECTDGPLLATGSNTFGSLVIANNLPTYDYFAGGTTHTGDTVETTVFTKTLLKNHLNDTGIFRVEAYITKSGVADTCAVRIKLGGTLIGTYTHGAADWGSEARLFIRCGTSKTQQLSTIVAFSGTAVVQNNRTITTEDFGTDLDLTITVQLANGADTAGVDYVKITPVQHCF